MKRLMIFISDLFLFNYSHQIILSLLIACSICQNVRAGQNEKTHFVITQVVEGPIVDKAKSLLEEAYSKLGYTIDFEFLQSEAALKQSNQGVTDGEMVRVVGMEKKYPNLIPVPVPYIVAENVLFAKQDWAKKIYEWDDLIPIVKDKSDIGLRIGLKKGENQLNSRNLPYTGFKTIEEALKSLSEGKTSLIYEECLTGSAALKKLAIKNVKALEPPLDSVGLYHYVHKSNRFLVPQLEKVFRDIIRTGEKKKKVVDLTPEEQAWLKEHPDICVGVGRAWPPYQWVDEDGQYYGLGSDYLKLIGERIGIKLKLITDISWNQVVSGLQDGTVDLTPFLGIDSEREEFLSFAGPLMTIPSVIMTRMEEDPVNGLENFVGRKVGTGRNYLFHTHIEQNHPGIELALYDRPLDGLLALSSGEIDAYVGYLGVMGYLIQKENIGNLKVARFLKGFEKVKFYSGVRKDLSLLASIMDKAIASISDNEHNAIIQKWAPLQFQQQEALIEAELTEKEQDWLDKKHPVHVRIVNFPPFIIVPKDQKPTGICIDYLNLIAQRTGVNFKYIITSQPFAEALEGLKQQRGPDLIATMMRTKEREKYIAFTKEYMWTPRVIFTAVNGPFIANMGDLSGKVVSLQKGSVAHRDVEKNYKDIKLMLFDTDAESIKAVSMGNADTYIGNMMVGSYLILQHGLTNVKVAAPTKLNDHIFSIGLRKDWPELRKIINKGLDTISSSERLNIRNKYMSVRYEHGIRPIDIFKWVAGVASVLLVILSIIVLWNRRLDKEIKERIKAEKALTESENKYRGLSDAAFEGIIISDKGKILDVNRVMTNMSGYSTTEILGMRTVDLVAPENRDEVTSKILSDYEKPYEANGLKKDGTIFPIEAHAKMFTYQGRPVRVTAVRDLTEQKKREEEIKILSGLVPICSSCKKIRDDKGYWNFLESYIEKHSEASFSHGMCPDCSEKLYGDEDWYIEMKKKKDSE